MKTDFEKIEPPQIVDAILREAAELHASDVYWLPDTGSYGISFRVAGEQMSKYRINHEAGLQCVARIKVLSQLLTYRNQISQDGVIRDEKRFPGIEFRVAVIPTVCGERITLRLMNSATTPLMLEELGFQPETEKLLHDMLAKSGGMILMTGPTGCGKTTTIYALIRELIRQNQDPASILTIEDPVECRIEGVSQISLSKANDEWNYAHALRAALRQDVKTLVIGEMRDREVIKVALDAALTGHRVISTFHAGDIPSVYARILHQGFEPFLAAAAITGIVSQRLIKTVEGKMAPLAAVLIPDDPWRDFVIENPSLSDMRKRLKGHVSADLPLAAERLAERGLIAKKDVYLI